MDLNIKDFEAAIAELESVVKKLEEPPKRKGGQKVADVDELWKKLHEEAKVL